MQRLRRAQALLQAHHSSVRTGQAIVKKKTHPMGGWSQGKGKQKGQGKSQWWQGAWPRAQKEQEKPQKKKSGKEDDPKLPGYKDFVSKEQGSSSSSSVVTAGDSHLRHLLKDVVETNNLRMSKEVAEAIAPDPMEELKLKQKDLNDRRKLVQKLEKVKVAKSKREEAYKAFLAYMEQHRTEEEKTYEKEMGELLSEIKTLELAITEAKEEGDMPVETLTVEEELRRQLEDSQEAQRETHLQLMRLQQQFQACALAQSSKHSAEEVLPNESKEVVLPSPSDPSPADLAKKQREFRMRQIQLAAGKFGTDLAVPKRLRSRSPKRESQEDSQEFAAAFLVDDKAKL